MFWHGIPLLTPARGGRNGGHRRTFRFQAVRATAVHAFSLRTVGDYIGLQWGLIGFVLLPVVLSGLGLTAWRGGLTA